MELKHILDFLTYKVGVIDNKFDEMKHEIKQEINKISDRLEIIVTKVTELVIIFRSSITYSAKTDF